MAVRQVWQQISASGDPPMAFEQWLATLPYPEQQEYLAAKQRQHAHRQQAIDQGLMHIDSAGGYVWRDEAAAQQGKPQDETWARYHARYHRECGIEMICIEEKI